MANKGKHNKKTGASARWSRTVIIAVVMVVLAALIFKRLDIIPKGPAIDIIFTSNMEGAVLDLPCNNMGRGEKLFTIPQVMHAVAELRKQSEKENVPYVIIDGGNTLFGVDNFSYRLNGEPAMKMMDKAGYELIFPGELENGSFDRISKKYIPIYFLRTHYNEPFYGKIGRGERNSSLDKYSVEVKRPGYNIEFFSFYNNREPGLKEDDFTPPFTSIEQSKANLKIALCRVNNLEKFVKRLKGVDVVIPCRYHDGIPRHKPSRIGKVLALPYVNSRYDGAARFRIYKTAGGYKADVKFKKPKVNPDLPDFLAGYEEEFRKTYGKDYEKVHTAMIGVGHRGLTHNLKRIHETPTSMAVADMIRYFAGTDVAVINLMSVRKELAGVIRGEAVEWTLPFGNTLVTMDLTGEQIEAVMRNNLRRNSSFIVISGGQVKYSADGKSLELMINGVPIDKKKTYRVATNDYLAKGGKPPYRVFKMGKDVHKTGVPLNAIFLSHIIRSRYIDEPPQRVNARSRKEIKNDKEAYKYGYFDLIKDRDARKYRGGLYYQKARLYMGVSTNTLDAPFPDINFSIVKAINSDPTDFEYHADLIKGMKAYVLGDVKKAAALWKKAANTASSDRETQRLAALFKDVKATGEHPAKPPVWPMFKGGPRRVGRSPFVGPKGDKVEVLWKFKTHHSIKSSPAIAGDGTIYFGGGDGYFYALDKRGKLKWKYQVGGYILSSPAIDPNSGICFGGSPPGASPRRRTFDEKDDKKPKSIGYIYSLNSDGTLNWRYKTGGWVASSPVTNTRGDVIVGCNDHYVYNVNIRGDLNWKFKTGGKVLSSPALDSYGRVYVGSEDFHLYCIDYNGKLKWKYKAQNKFFSSPAIAGDGTIYIGNDDHNLYVFTPEGKLKWKKKFPAPVTSTASIDKAGNIYVGCENGVLYHITADGKPIWRFKGGDEFFSSPVIDREGNVFIGCEDNFLYAINPKGKLTWKFETGDYVESTPVIARDGLIYLSAEDKFFYALQWASERP